MGAKTPQTNVRLTEDGRALLSKLSVNWGIPGKPLDKGMTIEKALLIAGNPTRDVERLDKAAERGLVTKSMAKGTTVIPQIVRAPLLKPKGKIA